MSTGTYVDPDTGLPVPIPIPSPLGGQHVAIPHPGNPLPAFVDQTERKWETVAGWVSTGWHKAVSFLEGAASIGINEVETIVNTAINYSQTAWSTYINGLEDWIVTGIDELGTALDIVTGSFADQVITLVGLLEAAKADALQWVADAIAEAERYADVVVDGLAQALVNGLVGIEAWVTDTVVQQLLGDLAQVETSLRDEIYRVAADVETYARDLVNAETLERLAAIGALAAAIADITTWLNDCGEPMCAEFGPKTDLSKLLKLLDAAGLLALLVELSQSNFADLEGALRTLAADGGHAIQTFDTLFVHGGDTVAETIAGVL